MTMLTLLVNIGQIVQVVNDNRPFLTKDDARHIDILQGDGPYAIAVNENGIIEDIGTVASITGKYKDTHFESVIDCQHKCVIPGFVDAHTHPVWSGDRVHEFALKLAGASYMEIHQAGGGIHYTVEQTTKASEEDLYESCKERLLAMLKKGTTTVECKSGYGLHWETEKKMLKVITRAKRDLQLGISATYLAAHSVPKGSTAEEATKDITENQIPLLRDSVSSGELEVDNIDVFCEKGVFDVAQTERILRAGRTIAGLNANFHADELNPIGGAELAGRLSVKAVSHLEEVTPAGIAALAQSETAAVLLPTTAYILRLRPPPAREMINAGVPVALGSDFNPNAYCLSMPIVMNLACVLMKMSLEEALVSATLNAAYALNLSDKVGSITAGKQADLILLNSSRWEHVIYQLGETEALIDSVFIKGRIVSGRQI